MALSCSSNDTRNFESVTVASVDVIKLPLRDILDRHIKPRVLYHKITSCSTLNLRPEQKTICLIPPPDLPDYNTFDVTLLYTLIRNLCPLPCPKRGWGNKPEDLDLQISDDIERLRLFRNNYYAHANSAAISDHMFKNIWRDLKQTFTRIESKYKLDYKDELLRIEQSKYTHSHWQECMLILNAYASRQKETDETPDIIIHGENEIICGGTAQFEADVKKVESSCWSVAWQKQRGNVIERINTRMERYSGSTKKKLVIKTVCKEDEGEYQAVLSLESKGSYFKSRNTIRLHVLGGLPNITTSLETNVKTRSVKLTANIYFYDDSPGIFETFWTKNDKKINPEESGKVLSEMTTHNPSLTIRNVGPDDAGEYQLTAINDVGSSTSDVIILGIPSVFAKNIEENDEGLRITVTIKSLPPPCHVQWSAKRRDDENFTPIDINTEEYKGTTISFPHPVLVVRHKDQLEKNCFQIKVTNFIGKTVQEISGNDNPAVSKNTDTVRNTVYTDLNASVRFMKLNNILAEQFPCQKVETLKFLLTSSNKVKLKNSVLDAKSAMDCLKILQDEKLFTPTDVIFMQFLCRETGCLELYDKCKDYAEKQEALCFFEKRSVNGYLNVQFHVQGDLSRYTKEYLQDVIKTVAAIVDCKEEDILLKSIEHSESFLLSLALKDVYILKMLALKEQDRLKLRKLNIDFFIIHKETIHLEKAKVVRQGGGVTRPSDNTKMAESSQPTMQSLYMDKMSPELRTKLESYIKTLEDQSKPVPNDDGQERLCKYINEFVSHFGNERVILTGSTIKGLRLRSHKDERDFDYLIISDFYIPVDALEQREDLPCFVHIRIDKHHKFFPESLIVDGEYLHTKVLKEFEDTTDFFPITSGIKPILTAPKIYKGRHSKHLEINLEAKPGTSQIHYFITKTEDLDPEILSVIHEEYWYDALNFQSAIRSSILSIDVQDYFCKLVSQLEDLLPIETTISMLFQTLSGFIKSITSSENIMPPSKRICKRESETDSDPGKVYRVPYLYKGSRDLIAAFPLVENPPYLENWKQRMMSRKDLLWPKPDTIENICSAKVYVVAKPAIVDPNPSKDFCLGFNQAEHILAKSFSPDQRLCLLLLKSLQKGFLEIYSDTLTTFHWNNAFYHKCGEIDPSLFDRHSTIFVALGNVLTYMAECLENGYLQHYFIESNLLAHIPQKKTREIAAKIKEILQDPERALQVYFDKKPTDQICLISKKDLNRAKESWNQLHQAGNIIGTWSANDDSTLQNALLDTLRLVLKKEKDFQGEGSVSEDSPGTSASMESQIGQLMAEGLQYHNANFSNRQERKRALEGLRSKAFGTIFSSIFRK